MMQLGSVPNCTERRHKVTEKEKREHGQIYNPNYDEELRREMINAQELCFDYNSLRPSDLEGRSKQIQKIVGKIGKNFLIEQPFMCDYGYNIEIGDNFYANHNLIILDAAKVIIGDNVFIAPNCSLYTAYHPIDVVERNKGLEYARSIKIGSNVWIGGNVTILPGVTIGDNTTIGAGSVVTKDIPANVVAHGNPCRVVRKI